MVNTANFLPGQPQVAPEHIQSQKDRFFRIIKDVFGHKTDRWFSLMGMYTDMEGRLLTAPASSRIHFHNAYPGGYLDHVLNVIDAAYLLRPVYEKLGGLLDFTEQEMVFAAMHHDLGKLGDADGPAYFPS